MAARDDYSRLILAELGNVNPSQDIKDWVTGWSMFETGGSTRPAHNPLACGLKMPGSSNFNDIVQNYVNESEGATAIALNLQEPHAGYHDIVVALQSQDRVALASSAGVATGLNTWGTGSGHMAEFFSTGAAHRDDDYDTGTTSLNPQTTDTGGDCTKAPCGCADTAHAANPGGQGGWACFWCIMRNSGPGGDVTKNCYGGTSPTGATGSNQQNPLQVFANLVNSPGNLIKFIAGLATFALGLGLIYEVLSKQPVVSSVVSKAKTALAFA